MALRQYKCKTCGCMALAFENEQIRLVQHDGNCSSSERPLAYTHDFEALPPNPVVVHTTDTWMSEAHIDSFQTVYELDRQLNIEAANERETKAMLEARKNA